MGQRSKKDENSSFSLPNSIDQFLKHNQRLCLETQAKQQSCVSEGVIHYLLQGMQMLPQQFFCQQMHRKGKNHYEPWPAKDLVLFQFQYPLTTLCQRFCDSNPGLEDYLTLVLELNYSLGNLIGAPSRIPHSNFQ